MKTMAAAVLAATFLFPAFARAGNLEATESSTLFFGGVEWSYLRLNLRRWEDPAGNRLERQHLARYGGRLGVSGPFSKDGNLYWRLAGVINAAGRSREDVGDLSLAMITGGVAGGLSWRPGRVGLGVELAGGGGLVSTEIKVEELPGGWDGYRRRETGLLYWEPVLTLDIPVSGNVVVRLLGGYSFIYGQGSEVGGPTFGLICDIGGWL